MTKVKFKITDIINKKQGSWKNKEVHEGISIYLNHLVM